MSDSKTIHSIVKINGGDLTGLDTQKSTLESRELYFSDDGYLYVGQASPGNPANACKIKSSLADVATTSNAVETNLLKVSKTGGTATVGPFTLTSDLLKREGTGNGNNEGLFYISKNGGIGGAVLSNSTIVDSMLTGISLVAVDKIVLQNGRGASKTQSTSYGTSLPNSGSEGELFFLIPSET